MTSRSHSAWQKLVALAPLLMLVVYLPGQLMLRCRADGLLRAACCCPDADAEAAADGATPVVKAEGCCDRELPGNPRPTVERARAFEHDFAWSATVVAVAPPVAPGALPSGGRGAAAWQRNGQRRDGPPIVLAKQAFLI